MNEDETFKRPTTTVPVLVFKETTVPIGISAQFLLLLLLFANFEAKQR